MWSAIASASGTICPSRAKGTTPRRPRARTDQRGTPPGQASTRALKDANDRGGARRGTRAHDAANPGGGSRCVTPETDGRKPTPSGRSLRVAPRRFRVWDGARLADRRLSSSRKARVEPLWMPRPVLNGGEQCRPRASQRELSLRPAPGRRATGQASSLLPSPRLWICMGLESESARPIRSADLPIPGNLPRVEILIFSRTLAGRCPRVAWHHGRVRRHGYTPTRARTPST